MAGSSGLLPEESPAVRSTPSVKGKPNCIEVRVMNSFSRLEYCSRKFPRDCVTDRYLTVN